MEQLVEVVGREWEVLSGVIVCESITTFPKKFLLFSTTEWGSEFFRDRKILETMSLVSVFGLYNTEKYSVIV